ncbi:hypothetical protein, partial [Aeromonas dhakensis]|uniref:hypothetical protein n=1 Tax=Aeromonas dhakensis TaxID=196024 RepID=UPI00398619F7
HGNFCAVGYHNPKREKVSGPMGSNPDGTSQTSSQRTLSTTLRFNGHEYPVGEWNNLPSKEWWK